MSKEYTRLVTVLGQIPVAGQIIFHDDFDGLLNFTKEGTAGDFIFEIDPSIAYKGNHSLKIKTRTAEAAESDEISAVHYSHLSVSKLLVASGRFLSPDFDKMAVLEFDFVLYDETNLNRAKVSYIPSVPSWRYLNSGNVETAIVGATAKPFAAGWHFYELIADFASNVYKSLQIDDQFFDLSGLPIYSFGSLIRRHLRSTIRHQTVGAAPSDLNLDEFLLHEI